MQRIAVIGAKGEVPSDCGEFEVVECTSRRDVRLMVARGRFDVFVNLHQQQHTSSSCLSACEVAATLEELKVPYGGVRHIDLCHSLSTLRMVTFYADVSVPSFIVVSREKNPFDDRKQTHHASSSSSKSLTFPVVVVPDVSAMDSQADVNMDIIECTKLGFRQQVATPSELTTILETALNFFPKIIVEEECRGVHAEIFAYATDDDAACVSVLFEEASSEGKELLERDRAVIKQVGEKLVSGVLHGVGFLTARIVFPPIAERKATPLTVEKIIVTKVFLNSFPTISSSNAVQPAMRIDLVKSLAKSGLRIHERQALPFEVSFDNDARGYFLRAKRDIPSGEVVFRDEGRAFNLVTKPHVERTWSDEDKIVFSRYAWPVDDGGHVYAIWSDNPSDWRPINHSCDPNLFFAAPHSLNVVARRDIKAGEDLTLDYATFCDVSMKPFRCYCGSPCCRGLIEMNSSCAQYGENSWFRRAAVAESVKK